MARKTQLDTLKDNKADLVKQRDKALADARVQQAEMAKQQKIIYDPGSTPTQVANAKTAYEKAKNLDAQYRKTYGELVAKIEGINAQIKNAKLGIFPGTEHSHIKDLVGDSTKTSGDNTSTPPPEGPQPTITYKYNLPMVNYAYMSLKGPQAQSSTLQNIDPGTLDNADNAWTTSYGTKGVLQTSRHYPYWAEGKQVVDDQTVYGFKFHYNPTTVNMGWSVDTSYDVAKFMAGQLTAMPMTDVGASNVTFSIILNRIFDMNHIDEYGDVTGTPYQGNVSNLRKEAKMIYERGTMYDLEYLFRVTNGKNVTFNSSLNGKTADLGWMQSFPIELHLGTRLRYVVRLVDLQVQHRIFNERMVPLFSIVDLVCKRLPDPSGFGKNTISSSSAGGVRFGSNGGVVMQ